MKNKSASFSKETLNFLLKAGRQKNPDWLEKNRKQYEDALLEPLKHFATELKSEFRQLAPDYHFPQKGIGRLRRSAQRAAERGGLFFKNWMTYSASRPTESRFDHNPNFFFFINPEDKDDPVLIAGGLYMPSSRQMRSIREAIARDASAFDRLFASKEFNARFPGGFSLERTSKRPPRGFDPAHPRMDWLKLQGFFVWRSYSMKDFTSKNFASLAAKDFKQILRLNRLLEQALTGRLASSQPAPKKKRTVEEPDAGLLSRLEDLERVERKIDFDF